MDELLKYGPLIALILNGLGLWWVWSMRKAFATPDDVNKLHRRINDVTNRVSLAEQKLASVPTISEVGDLKVQLASIHGDYKAMAATMEALKDSLEGIQSAVQHISEHLLNTKAGR
jgi:predicted  nucleic acid-binding Zn-ribbon protein